MPVTRESWEITSADEWHARRGKDWTCSNLDVLFGLNPYTTLADRVAVWSGHAPRPPQTPAQRRGVIMQPAIALAVQEVHPEWRIVPATTYHRITELRFGCTPDFWVYVESSTSPLALIEAKTVNERTWETWHGHPPLGYTLQTLGQMIITEQQRGVLAVMVMSSELPLYLYEVGRHPAAEAKILTAVAEFWRQFDAGEISMPQASEEIAALLDDGSHRDLSADNQLPEWLERRAEWLEQRGQLDRNLKGVDYEIKNRMGPASTGWLPGWEITFRAEHRKGYTVEPSDPRILRVKRTKEKTDDIAF